VRTTNKGSDSQTEGAIATNGGSKSVATRKESQTMSLDYNKKLIPRAKELRKNMTKQEKHLWYDYLAKYPVRFQRQKTIDNFIVDFYCHKAHLVIEVDGSQHYTEDGIVNDENRTKILNAYSIDVLRFSNFDIERNFEGVCRKIDKTVKESLKI
jgi:very-short-patch-repair endonuclease